MLTDRTIKSLAPRAKLFRLADAAGLSIEVDTTGSKRWRLRYRFADRQKMLSLGTYPSVSLAEARVRRDEARKLLGRGVDPSAQRKLDKLNTRLSVATSFKDVAEEWLSRRQALSATTKSKLQWLLGSLAFPWIGERPISSIGAQELLAVLRRIESRGKHETTRRLKQVCGQVFRYAIVTGRAERDPSGDLRGALSSPTVKHHAAITDPRAVGELIRAIYGFSGTLTVAIALKLAPLVFVRPGELRRAEWSEIDLGTKEWRIPAEKMKMRQRHIVPLSTQSLALLEDLKPLTGSGKYVFPSIRDARRPMSENTITAALRRIGYTGHEMTGHGFRAMASTMLHERGWSPEVIERQLAHGERNKVKAAYNHAEHLSKRREMMQSWADYLDELSACATPL